MKLNSTELLQLSQFVVTPDRWRGWRRRRSRCISAPVAGSATACCQRWLHAASTRDTA